MPIDVSGFDTVGLCVSFVKGDSQGCEIMWSFSPDGDHWYRDENHRQLDNSLNTRIDVPIHGLYMMVYYVALGQSTNTSLSVIAVLETLKGK